VAVPVRVTANDPPAPTPLPATVVTVTGRDGKRYPATRQDRQPHTPPEPGPDPDHNPEDPNVRGKGITLAHEAINSLSRIPKNDALRHRGFQLVLDWFLACVREECPGLSEADWDAVRRWIDALGK
jgi:hypothetical protein